MFLILNNEIAFNKQILRVEQPPKKEQTSHFSDISAYGYTTGQIVRDKDVTIVIHGTIKNINKLARKIFVPESLEALLILYSKYGFEYMLQLLEGEFSIILLDHNLNKSNSRLYVAQDRLGLCPLYMFVEDTTADRKIFAFANTVKQLHLESVLYNTNYTIQPFVPGTYSQYEYPFKVLSYWKPLIQNARYVVSWPKKWLSIVSKAEQNKEFLKAVDTVKEALRESIMVDLGTCQCILKGCDSCTSSDMLPDLNPPSQPLPITKRILSNSRQMNFYPPPKPNFGPIGCLLSGGIDSSIVAGLMRDQLKLDDYNPDQILYTFAMGFEGSSDLKYAKEMAEYMGGNANHTELVITEDSYMAAIPAVIEILETADIATIRYGVALYLILSHIHDKTSIRDIFTGDGADESMGGFLNFYYMTNAVENDYECNQLLNAYHKSGALYRKLFDHFGMRWYRPFLNEGWLTQYMSLPIEFRYEVGSFHTYPHVGYEFDKDLLRIAFSEEYFKTALFTNLLPKSILWRTSEPGYDSISSYYKPLNRIIEDNLTKLSDTNDTSTVNEVGSYIPNMNGLTEPMRELEYYRGIYKQYYPHMKTRELGVEPPYKYAKTIYEPTMRNLDVYLEFHMEYQDRTV